MALVGGITMSEVAAGVHGCLLLQGKFLEVNQALSHTNALHFRMLKVMKSQA